MDRGSGIAAQADILRGRAYNPIDRRRESRCSRALSFFPGPLFLRKSRGRRIRICQNALGLRGTEFAQGFTNLWVLAPKDGGGEQRGVDRSCLANRQRANRNAPGHLRNGEQGIETLES